MQCVSKRVAAVVAAGLLAGGCATATNGPPQPQIRYSKSEIAHRCAKFSEQRYEAAKARGPVVYGVITGVATLADPLWFAKSVREKAMQHCLDNGGNVPLR
jgi:hypothetical protein